MNALTPHVHEVLALEADIVALQEVRIGEDSLPSIRNTFKQFGLIFLLVRFPITKHRDITENRSTLTKPFRALLLLCDATSL